VSFLAAAFLFIKHLLLQVASPFPPSDKIGIKSVQREVEEIIPMKQMKMDWIPYIPLENRYPNFIFQLTFLYDFMEFSFPNFFFTYIFCSMSFLQLKSFSRESQVDRLRHQIFILSCTQRRYLAALSIFLYTHYIISSVLYEVVSYPIVIT